MRGPAHDAGPFIVTRVRRVIAVLRGLQAHCADFQPFRRFSTSMYAVAVESQDNRMFFHVYSMGGI
jgi:hypothetical protein